MIESKRESFVFVGEEEQNAVYQFIEKGSSLIKYSRNENIIIVKEFGFSSSSLYAFCTPTSLC